MSEVRTIPWETISEWFAKHEQTIRDVMKFEGLRGVINEVLWLAPDQPELAALREELAKSRRSFLGKLTTENMDLQQRLSDAERRNASFLGLLQRAYDADLAARQCQPYNASKLMDDIGAALNSTESGASE